jgi:hypothetical protein
MLSATHFKRGIACLASLLVSNSPETGALSKERIGLVLFGGVRPRVWRCYATPR